MISRKFFVLFFIAGFCYSYSHAQSSDFCNAVNTIVRDAPNKFRNVRGKTLQANQNVTMWDCSIKVPEVIGSRFVASMGLYYEGAFFQTKNSDEVKAAYDKYKKILASCLTANGYTMSESDNFYSGLSSCKKLVFMTEGKEEPDTTKPVLPPPHIAMEVTYSKEVGKYTIVMFIFEH